MATLEQILNYRNLTGVIRSVKSGIPNPLPLAFFSVGRRVSGNTAEYYRVTGNRQLAKLAHYGSPAQRRELRGVDNVPIKLLHTFESQQWPLALTINLTKMTELTKDSMGQQQAEYQSTEFKRGFANLRIASTMMVLFTGVIFADKDGNVLPSSAGAAYTIDFAVPAGNKNQLGGTISTTWSNTSANIVTQLLNLQTKARQTTGYEIENAFYGDQIPEMIAANATAQQYLKHNPGMNQQFVNSGAVPQGFGGIKNWIHAGSAFFADKNNTVQNILASDNIVFTPAPSPEWFEVIEGSFPVPRTVVPQMGSSAAEMLGNVAEEFGMFQYGCLTLNPPTVEQFAGDTFLPTLKVPNCIWLADVVF